MKSALEKILRHKAAWVVGGSVRDRILGRNTPDLDLVVHAPDFYGKKIAKALKGTLFALDKARGIYRVSLPDGNYIDLAERQGKVFEDDIDRRDFSVNAMCAHFENWFSKDWKAALIDRHHGADDLKKCVIRAISKQTFPEDPLRMLRAFRQAAELGFSIDSKTLSAIKLHRKKILKSAPERRRDEMLKMFSTPRSYKNLVLMEKTGILEVIFPNAVPLRRTAVGYYGKGGVLKHTLESVLHFENIMGDASWFKAHRKHIDAYMNEKISGYPRFAHCKWALLLHDIGKPSTAKVHKGRLRFFEHDHVGARMVPKLSKFFRWSNEELSRYSSLVRNHMRPGSLATGKVLSDKAIHRFFRDLGDDAIAMLVVSLADHLTYLTPKQIKKRNSDHERATIKMVNQYYAARDKVVPPRLLSGHDIMKAFKLDPSPLIGELLRDLSEAQSEGNIHTKEDALCYLKKRIPS